MAESFRANWDAQGTELSYRSIEEDRAAAQAGGASTDMGNITHILPACKPSYKIDTKFGNHHPGFTEFCAKPQVSLGQR